MEKSSSSPATSSVELPQERYRVVVLEQRWKESYVLASDQEDADRKVDSIDADDFEDVCDLHTWTIESVREAPEDFTSIPIQDYEQRKTHR